MKQTKIASAKYPLYFLITTMLFVHFTINFAWAESWFPPDVFSEKWTRLGEQNKFDNGELTQHINGAAELFLELGFESLQIQSYTNNQNVLELEVYTMTTPAAARSIFYSRRTKPVNFDEDTSRISVNRYQCIFTVGLYYVQINNLSTDPSLIPEMNAIAHEFIQKTSDHPLKLITLLPEKNRIPGTLSIFNGPISLKPVILVGNEDLFFLRGKIFGVAAEYRNNQYYRFLQIVISYPSSGQAKTAMLNFAGIQSSCLKIVSWSEKNVNFISCDQKQGLLNLSDNLLIIKVDLSPPMHHN